MIIKLDSSYHNKVIKYLEKEEEFNLLTIGDIERYGYDNYFLNIWAGINIKGDIEGVLVKCFEFIIFYAYDQFNVDEFADLISNMEFTEISGKSNVVDLLAYKLNIVRRRKVKFCKLESKELFKYDDLNIKVKKMRFIHLNKVAKLYEAIEEFENTTVENLRNGLKTGRGYFIEQDKHIVAMAKSTSENKNYAMIVGVGTHPKYRNRGLATKCIVKICSELLGENKTPCLFYDNEKAGEIYHKLGFENIGDWSIYQRNHNQV